MLRKYNELCLGQLGNAKITQHLIDLISGERAFNFSANLAVPKSRALEQFKIDLKSSAIEHSVFKWAAPLLFAPKKYGPLRFRVYYR